MPILQWDTVLLWYSPSLPLSPQLRVREVIKCFTLPSGGASRTWLLWRCGAQAVLLSCLMAARGLPATQGKQREGKEGLAGTVRWEQM